MARVVASGKDADAVGMVLAEELRDDFGLCASAIAVINIVTVAVAHDQGLAHAVGIAAHAVEGVGNLGRSHAVDAAQEQLGARRHAAIGGMLVVIGHGDVHAVNDDA